MLRSMLLVAMLSSCYVEEPAVVGPRLTLVEPGVEVIADFDYPVFFADGVYWRWYGGYWYQSPFWDHGWVYARAVPPHIRGISRPGRYTHYHGGRISRPAPRPHPHPIHRG